MTSMPSGVEKYSETAVFTQDTIPKKLSESHTTKAGVWAKIRIIEGTLAYWDLEGGSDAITLSPAEPGIVPPLRAHRIEAIGPVRFQVEFFK